MTHDQQRGETPTVMLLLLIAWAPTPPYERANYSLHTQMRLITGIQSGLTGRFPRRQYPVHEPFANTPQKNTSRLYSGAWHRIESNGGTPWDVPPPHKLLTDGRTTAVDDCPESGLRPLSRLQPGEGRIRLAAALYAHRRKSFTPTTVEPARPVARRRSCPADPVLARHACSP